jgi:20S proteasome alpha/beta subunit
VFHGYWGCAAGKAKQAATTEIEKLSMKNMSCQELIKQAAKIIYTVHDEVKVGKMCFQIFQLNIKFEFSEVCASSIKHFIRVSDEIN